MSFIFVTSDVDKVKISSVDVDGLKLELVVEYSVKIVESVGKSCFEVADEVSGFSISTSPVTDEDFVELPVSESSPAVVISVVLNCLFVDEASVVSLKSVVLTEDDKLTD